MGNLAGEWPPRRVEITVYGHTESTYEAVTGVRGSFQRFRRGVDLLLQHGLPLYLKTIVLRTPFKRRRKGEAAKPK